MFTYLFERQVLLLQLGHMLDLLARVLVAHQLGTLLAQLADLAVIQVAVLGEELQLVLHVLLQLGLLLVGHLRLAVQSAQWRGEGKGGISREDEWDEGPC